MARILVGHLNDQECRLGVRTAILAALWEQDHQAGQASRITNDFWWDAFFKTGRRVSEAQQVALLSLARQLATTMFFRVGLGTGIVCPENDALFNETLEPIYAKREFPEVYKTSFVPQVVNPFARAIMTASHIRQVPDLTKVDLGEIMSFTSLPPIEVHIMLVWILVIRIGNEDSLRFV